MSDIVIKLTEAQIIELAKQQADDPSLDIDWDKIRSIGVRVKPMVVLSLNDERGLVCQVQMSLPGSIAECEIAVTA